MHVMPAGRAYLQLKSSGMDACSWPVPGFLWVAGHYCYQPELMQKVP